MTNPALFLELVLIQTPIIMKNNYERSRFRPTFAKEAGSRDKDNCAYQIKINL